MFHYYNGSFMRVIVVKNTFNRQIDLVFPCFNCLLSQYHLICYFAQEEYVDRVSKEYTNYHLWNLAN